MLSWGGTYKTEFYSREISREPHVEYALVDFHIYSRGRSGLEHPVSQRWLTNNVICASTRRRYTPDRPARLLECREASCLERGK